MGWSWLRRRTDRGTAPASAVVPAPTAPVGQREPDWPYLAPVQRSLTEPLVPVAPLAEFTGSLATHQNPSFLGPLGHQIDPDGPGGLVTGLAMPRPGGPVAYAGAVELAVPPRDRPRPAVQRHSVTWSTPSEPDPASDPFPVDRPTPEPAGAAEEFVPEPIDGPSTDSGHITVGSPSTGSGLIPAGSPSTGSGPMPIAQRSSRSAESPSPRPGHITVGSPSTGSGPMPVAQR